MYGAQEMAEAGITTGFSQCSLGEGMVTFICSLKHNKNAKLLPLGNLVRRLWSPSLSLCLRTDIIGNVTTSLLHLWQVCRPTLRSTAAQI